MQRTTRAASSGRRSHATCAIARPSNAGAAKPAAPTSTSPVMKVLAPPPMPLTAPPTRLLPAAAATATDADLPPPAPQHDPPLLLAAPTLDSVRDRLVRDELPGLFRAQSSSSSAAGPTPSLYSEGVVFQDPLATTAGFPLYQVGIGAIRALFDVELVTHAAVVREAESAVVTRWTMVLKPRGVPDGGLPFFTGAARRPSVALTGTSAYGVDRATGRVVSHVDTWDSLPMRLQADARRRARAPAGASALGGDGAPSDGGGGGVGSDGEGGGGGALLLPPRPRGLLHFARRALRAALAVTPDLATPSYGVLYASPVYELRRYGRFALAETDMAAGADPAAGSGFGPLAGYIFGGNEAGKKWEMTTPVLTDAAAARDGGGGGEGGGSDRGARAKMAFVIDDDDDDEEGGGGGEEEGEEAAAATGWGSGASGASSSATTTTTTFAAPRDPAVSTRFERAGRLWASAPVPGWPLQGDVSRAERRLRAALAGDGVARATTAPGQYRLLRYNDPFTPPFLRRNELLVEVEWCAAAAANAEAKGKKKKGGGGAAADNAPWAEALLMNKTAQRG